MVCFNWKKPLTSLEMVEGRRAQTLSRASSMSCWREKIYLTVVGGGVGGGGAGKAIFTWVVFVSNMDVSSFMTNSHTMHKIPPPCVHHMGRGEDKT